MTRNKSVEVGSYSKSKPVKQEKKEKLSVSALFASMDQNHEKTKKPPMIKSKATPKVVSYTDGIDLPPSDDEDEDEEEGGYSSQKNHRQKEAVLLETRMTDKELKKREKKEMISANASEIAKLEALKDDHDAVTITIGKRASLLDGGDCVGANVKDISIEDISVSVRGIKLLSNVSVKISNGKKYGLVGPNGAGKSTLLKLLARRKIPVPKNIDLLFVEQEVVGDDRTTIEAVVSASTELMKLREEAAALQISSENEDVGEKLAEVYEKLQLLDSDKAEARASKILAGLGFTKEMQGRCTKSFSGGWRMRISLAQALFIQPTLLLLDEPTNHLDLKAVLWLEEYLCHWRKTLVVVSHDQDFLTTVCSDIIHVDDLQLYTYHGGFSGYQTGNAQLRKERLKKDEIREKQIKAAQRSGNQAQQKKVKEQAAAKESLRKRREYSVEFHFPVPTELASSSLLQLIEVSFEYPSRPDFRLADVDVGIDMATRVAIVGPNGAGKSTLLKLLAGDLTPTKGEARRSQKLRIGRYSQHFVDLLRMEDNPVQYLLRLHPDQQGPSRQEAVRAKLGKFGLPKENHLMPIAKLSGGQKARVVLTSICMLRPHILLLDEPTNHLDMESIDALADALDEFVGGVVLVSHNSRLISRVCQDEEKSQIWVVEDGTVKRYPGQFDEYKEELQMGIKEELGIANKI